MIKVRLLIAFIFILAVPICLFAQTNYNALLKEYEPLILINNFDNKELIEKYIGYDFSILWKECSKHEYIGYIGDGYERIRLKLYSAIKDTEKPSKYFVNGKSYQNGTICNFEGSFNITSIRRLAVMHWGVDDEYKNTGIKEQGIILGTYRLNQKNNGHFEGIFSALWYIDRAGKLKYDHIEDFADPFRNNQFIGIWKSDDGKYIKECNWGDYRIPQSGDLDRYRSRGILPKSKI